MGGGLANFAQACLELVFLLPPPPQYLGLQKCTTTPCFETGSHYLAQADLKFSLLPQSHYEIILFFFFGDTGI
jgi:hypothetical protein